MVDVEFEILTSVGFAEQDSGFYAGVLHGRHFTIEHLDERRQVSVHICATDVSAQAKAELIDLIYAATGLGDRFARCFAVIAARRFA